MVDSCSDAPPDFGQDSQTDFQPDSLPEVHTRVPHAEKVAAVLEKIEQVLELDLSCM